MTRATRLSRRFTACPFSYSIVRIHTCVGLCLSNLDHLRLLPCLWLAGCLSTLRSDVFIWLPARYFYYMLQIYIASYLRRFVRYICLFWNVLEGQVRKQNVGGTGSSRNWCKQPMNTALYTQSDRSLWYLFIQ